jgi:hypothetical protein
MKSIHLKLGKVCIGKLLRGIPYSPNYLNTKHWAVRAKWRTVWKEEVWGVWQENKKQYKIELPFQHAILEFVVYYARLPQDSDNLTASMKPIIDGLKDCGIIIDDNPKHLFIKPPTYIKCEKVIDEHIELIIT